MMGAGRTELVEALMGTRRASGGEVSVRGVAEPKGTVQARIAAGLALVPEDRQRDGLVQTMSVKDNILLSTLYSVVLGLIVGLLVRRVVVPNHSRRATRVVEPERRIEPARLAALK